jgi:hypothetical protein
MSAYTKNKRNPKQTNEIAQGFNKARTSETQS